MTIRPRRNHSLTFKAKVAHPDFIRLVMIENIHEGRHMANMKSLVETNVAAISILERICKAGVKAGLFREDVSPLALHWQISAMSFFNVANRNTFSILFGDSLFSDLGQDKLREEVARTVVQSVLKPA